MKHELSITIALIVIFLLSQVTGLFLVNKSVSSIENVNGTIVVNYTQTAIGPRPETRGVGSFIYILAGILIGTILVLLLVKYNKIVFWKLWFFLAVWISISVALGVIMKSYLAMIFALILAIVKIYKPNIFVHNFSEILMYAGIAVLLVPLFDVFWMFMLLIAISFYDMFAVWKSKHMVKMALFQTRSNVFAGLMIPYKRAQPVSVEENKKETKKFSEKTPKPKLEIPIKIENSENEKDKRRNAILGGGDIAFPLLFSGVVMGSLIKAGITKVSAFYQTTIITLTATIALFLLFSFAKKDRFYPAMPFISLGCVLGYIIIWIINNFRIPLF